MSVQLENIRAEIYNEVLPENWWDGRFNTMSVGVTQVACIESVSKEPFCRKIIVGLGLSCDKRTFKPVLGLSSFQVIRDGEFVSHPFFRLRKAATG